MLSFSLGNLELRPLRVLCLGAHSDDIEIGCGGSVLTLLSGARPVDVHWVVFSAKEKRATEAIHSADAFLSRAREKCVAVREFRDGFLPFLGSDIKEEFERLKEDCCPDIVFTHYRSDRHQDHRLISDMTWSTFRNHLVLEYEVPKYDGDFGAPNFFVPLAEEVCRKKVKTIVEGFASQSRKHWFDEETFWSVMRIRGMEINSPTRLAEAFYCRKSSFFLGESTLGRTGQN